MNKRERAQAEKLLGSIGRLVTGVTIDGKLIGISTDGAGSQAQPFGTPKIFWSLQSVHDYVDAKERPQG